MYEEFVKKRLANMNNSAIISYKQIDRQGHSSVIFAYNFIVKFAI